MLTVYKASAGSGKTFRLAVEYIKHLIVNPYSYEHILAVTFTNKATEEMKMRILSQLYGLAHHEADAKAYLNVILSELRKTRPSQHFNPEAVDEEFIATRSLLALHNLLHHYSAFRVETIDRFFQKVLRNLAHELDLTPNLRVELSDKEIESEAVDTWINKLRETDREMTWVIDFIHSSMDDEKKWDVISKIKKFAETLIHDDYKDYSRQLAERFNNDTVDFYREYTRKLRYLITQPTQDINAAGKRLCDILDAHQLNNPDYFAQAARGVYSFIHKMAVMPITELAPNTYVRKCLDHDDTEAANWITKSKPASLAVQPLIKDVLRQPFLDAMKDFEHKCLFAKSAAITISHLSKLRLLRAIQNEIHNNNVEKNRFLLSDTQTLLAEMIGSNDSPFIYEKIGTRLQNIMIDEFQDTSRKQWQNFKVLLNDCLSHNTDSLIVGDVKQSIYRWRAGDWRLLTNISQEVKYPVNEVSLKINRRSSVRVIKFNNAFFTKAAAKVAETLDGKCDAADVAMLRAAYNDVAQDYPEDKQDNGYVELRLFDAEDYDEQTLRFIADTIISLTLKNVKQKDIAILVRTNDIITDITDYCIPIFQAHESERVRRLALISDEAYMLSASTAVNIIIDALRLIKNPDDDIIRTTLSLVYQRNVLGDTRDQYDMISNQLLPKEFIEHISEYPSMPIYQLCEQLAITFGVYHIEGQTDYLSFFFDGVNDFLVKNIGADISQFIKYWDEVMHEKKIEFSSSEGIRILTIHKSKGLEYANVIVPFCDWQLEKTSILWCKPTEQPFSDLPVIPLDSSQKKMQNTIYEPYYWAEHLQNEVDNINLLYVAFTRAAQNLYITTQKKQGANSRGKLIEDVIQDVADELQASFNNDTFIYGYQPVASPSADKAEDIIGKPMPLGGIAGGNQDVMVTTTSQTPEIYESGLCQQFMMAHEEASDEQLQTQQNIRLGNSLHYILSKIHTVRDIPSIMLEMQMNGLLDGQDITAEELQDRLEKCFENPTVRHWFSDHWKLYNECTILSEAAGTDRQQDTAGNHYDEYRPDRVMTDGQETIVVDFKLFSFSKRYISQVQGYMNLLRQMGHNNVKGFLWLVFSNKIISV